MTLDPLLLVKSLQLRINQLNKILDEQDRCNKLLQLQIDMLNERLNEMTLNMAHHKNICAERFEMTVKKDVYNYKKN